jgi:hypothetical protein
MGALRARVLVADDSDVFLRAAASVISATSTLRLVGAGSGEEAIRLRALERSVEHVDYVAWISSGCPRAADLVGAAGRSRDVGIACHNGHVGCRLRHRNLGTGRAVPRR